MDIVEIRDIVNTITYKDGWSFIVSEKKGIPYIQINCKVGICSITKKPSPWKGRKQYISSFSTRQEVIGMCFSLLKDAEMHELHEWFRYKGASIYNPHLNPDALVEVAKKKENFDCRVDSMTNV